MTGAAEPSEGGEREGGLEPAAARPVDAAAGAYLPREAIAEFLRRVSRDGLPSMTRRLVKPFYVDDDLLRIVDQQIRNAFRAKDPLGDVTVKCQVRFADLSTRDYPELEECLASAGRARDPEALFVRWTLVTHSAEMAELVLKLVTEQALEPNLIEGPKPDAAAIQVEAYSIDRDWIESLFQSVVETLDANSSIPRQFAPLKMFGRSFTNNIVSHAIGVVLWINAFALLFREGGPSRAQRIAGITRHRGVGEKLDAFVRDYLRPEDSFSRVFIRLTIPVLLYVSVTQFGPRLLPRLFPKSSIGIGLVKRRREDRDNYRSLVIFGGVAAVLTGVVGNFIFRALTG